MTVAARRLQKSLSRLRRPGEAAHAASTAALALPGADASAGAGVSRPSHSSPNHSRAWWGDEPPAPEPSAETVEEERLQHEAAAAMQLAAEQEEQRKEQASREIEEEIEEAC